MTMAEPETNTSSTTSELIFLSPGLSQLPPEIRQEYTRRQQDETTAQIKKCAINNMERLCLKDSTGPLFSIKATELLLMCTGIEGSKKSEIIKKAFQVEDIGTVAGFSSHGFTAHDITGDTQDCHRIPELRRPSTLENFEIALFSALKVLKLVDKTERKVVSNEQHENDNLLIRIIENYQKLVSNDTDFHALMSEGIGLLNLWDVGLNRTVRPFLETFSQCFTDHVTLFLFININDMDKLYAPPSSKGDRQTTDQGDFSWRPKIQYLLRPVCQLDASTKLKCIVFLTYDSDTAEKDTVEDVRKALNDVCKMAFQQMEMSEEKIEYEVCSIAHNGDCKLLLGKIQSIAKEVKKIDIPFSHLLLRTILGFQGPKCITRDELRGIAEKYANMNEEDVAVFLKNFTAFGSILDVGQINPQSKFVIIKPTAFLVALHEYICKINDRTQKSPLISDENDKQIFDILVDMGMAYTYTTPNSQVLLPKLTSAFAFHGHEKHKEKTIQFVSSLGAPRLNMNIDIIKRLTKAFPQCKVTHGAANSTAIRVPQQIKQGKNDHVDISFTFLANVIEMSFDVTANIRTAHIRLVCGKVITTFKEIIEEKRKHRKNDFIKYHFAVLCKGDEIRRAESGQSEVFSAYRIRHVLPDKLCEDCHDVWSLKHDKTHDETSLMVIDVWRQLLEQGVDGEKVNQFAIPHELKLNGDLSTDNIAMLSKRLVKFPWRAVKILANELGVAIVKEEPLMHRKELTILAMLVQWEHDNHQHKLDSLRKIMAWKLHDTHIKWQKLIAKKEQNKDFQMPMPESDSFTKIARDLDMTVLTKEQRDEVLEAVATIRDSQKTDEQSIPKTSSDVQYF